MNREDVMLMAKEAGFAHNPKTGHIVAVDGFTEVRVTAGIERFAALVAAHEREECARVCDVYAELHGISSRAHAAHDLADAIRARGDVPR